MSDVENQIAANRADYHRRAALDLLWQSAEAAAKIAEAERDEAIEGVAAERDGEQAAITEEALVLVTDACRDAAEKSGAKAPK